jgi:hypothetical protein
MIIPANKLYTIGLRKEYHERLTQRTGQIKAT